MKIRRGAGAISLAIAEAVTTWRSAPYGGSSWISIPVTALLRSLRVMRTLGLNTLRELTIWTQTSQKSDLARLTPLLFEHKAKVAASFERAPKLWLR